MNKVVEQLKKETRIAEIINKIKKEEKKCGDLLHKKDI